jgi:oligopeptide/dipeptide ABC transporter ATP-binding protein
MYAGRIVETGTATAIFSSPRHPYTRALLNSTPRIDAPGARLQAIDGHPPDLRTPLAGCPFAPRCPQATTICTEQEPQPVNDVACHHA